MNLVSKRLEIIKPSSTLAVVKKAAELKAKGLDIISLGAGEPDFDTPQHIKNAAIKAINDGFTKYTAIDGIAPLKEAIIEKFLKNNEISYNTSQITIGNGAKQILFNAFLASLNPGDEVIIPIPYWVSYPDMVLLAGGVPVFVNCSIENNFKLSGKDFESKINSKTKWVILNSPNNPSGAAYSQDELKEITNVLLKHPHVNIISDDIYEHIVYDDFKFVTPAQIEPLLKNRILTVNGVSKAYSMTGWRIGYCGGPEILIKAMNKIQSQSTSNPCSISQMAALAALSGEQEFVKTNAEMFKGRRNLVVDLLNDIDGLSCNKPEGAFYVLPSCAKLFGRKTNDGKILENSNDVATYFLEEGNVAAVSGIAFGLDGFFRASYATSERNLEQAFSRIKKAVNKLS